MDLVNKAKPSKTEKNKKSLIICLKVFVISTNMETLYNRKVVS